MNNNSYWIPAAAGWLALASRLPALRRAPHDPLLRAVCAVFFFASSSFTLANPTLVDYVNHGTGITNAAAPLVYSLILAQSASVVVLILRWRGGPAEQVNRRGRQWSLAYASAAAVLFLLFAAGRTPVERPVDFDTYYANTPFIREMITLYLVASMAAAVAMFVMCWRWSTRVYDRTWLRRGLRLLVVGTVFHFGFDAARLTAVFARWAGADWDRLCLAAPAIGAVGTLCVAVGFTLPLITERVVAVRALYDSYRTLRALRPLWETLQAAQPSGAVSVAAPWWAVRLRLTRRITEIHDGLLALRPYYDVSARSSPSLSAEPAGPQVMASALHRAIRNKTAGKPPTPTAEHTGPLRTLAEPLPLASLVQLSRSLTTCHTGEHHL
ncbi:MAB_1171c family putative transporter [Streptomyces sp. NRRL F-5755]|uniref:MAB_1171c family putative transporter n=1 Tax=Streptomyces sp. NRRL F-5755 TaxID=1519475 RepID=UPI0006AE093F|nr:MAB_1171c family putative transporter [Streptomyces sp. NRRL F-5755]